MGKAKHAIALVGAGLSLLAGSVPVDVAHVRWLHPGEGFVVAGGVVNANGDASPDPFTAAGEAPASSQCVVPPGAPWPALAGLRSQVLTSRASLSVLDGTDGGVLWEVVWSPIQPAPDLTHVMLVEGAWGGDFDGDGSDEILVLRSDLATDGSGSIQRTEVYAASNGELLWSQQIEQPAGATLIRILTPTTLFGEIVAVFSELRMEGLDFSSTSRIVRLRSDGPPTPILDLGGGGGLGFGTIADDPDHPVYVGIVLRITPPPTPSIRTDVEAVPIQRRLDGSLSLTAPRWSKQGVAASTPVAFLDAPSPAVVFGSDNSSSTGSVTAFDLADGSQLWTSPLDVGPSGGSFITTDSDGNGSRDAVVASPAFGRSTPLGVAAEIVALDGATGQETWSLTDLTAKFRAWGLSTLDVDGDGVREIVAAGMLQDGFAGCSQPSHDPGVVAIVDASGTVACRYPLDRYASVVRPVDLDGGSGDELVVSTYGGRTWAFDDEGPACATAPLAPSIGLPNQN